MLLAFFKIEDAVSCAKLLIRSFVFFVKVTVFSLCGNSGADKAPTLSLISYNFSSFWQPITIAYFKSINF